MSVMTWVLHTSPMSTEMASLNSTSTSARVARTSSDSDSNENSTTPSGRTHSAEEEDGDLGRARSLDAPDSGAA
jgi:hypothetical protein